MKVFSAKVRDGAIVADGLLDDLPERGEILSAGELLRRLAT